MSVGVFFILIPLLCLLSLHVHGEDFLLMPVELAPVPCNDKAVEKLSRLAVTYINEDRAEGYKFALNRITNVHLHAQVSAQANSAGCHEMLSAGCFYSSFTGREKQLTVSQGRDLGAFLTNLVHYVLQSPRALTLSLENLC